MRDVLRKQAFFAVITFIVLFVGLLITQFFFAFSIYSAFFHSPFERPPEPFSSGSKIPVGLSEFLLVVSQTLLIGGALLAYFSWFDTDRARENLKRLRELSRQGKFISLRHDYSQLNIEAYSWFVRLFSPTVVIFGMILFYIAVSSL
jgi:hypothetical protein